MQKVCACASRKASGSVASSPPAIGRGPANEYCNTCLHHLLYVVRTRVRTRLPDRSARSSTARFHKCAAQRPADPVADAKP